VGVDGIVRWRDDKLKRLKQYERDYKAVIKDYKFEPRSLVLVRNTAVEKSRARSTKR